MFGKSRRKKKKEAEKNSLVINMGGKTVYSKPNTPVSSSEAALKKPTPVAPPPVESKPSRNKKTADAIYANENNMWVCRYCETLNENSKEKCAACGNFKK